MAARGGALQRPPAEQEADRVSEQILRSSAGRVHESAPAHEQGMALSETPAAVHDELASPGTPLGDGVRTLMESRFQHDFSRVRVHAGPEAAESADALRALAYTVGRHVVFGASRYRPDTGDGRRLLAHELTHVVQQDRLGGGVVQRFVAEDAAAEMVGKTFTISEDVTASGIALAKGTSIVIKTWENDKVVVTADVTVAGKTSTVTIKKYLLVPPRGSVLSQYTAGAKPARKSYTDLKAKIAAQKKVLADWELQEKNYDKNPGEWRRQKGVHELELKSLEYRLTGAHYKASTNPEENTLPEELWRTTDEGEKIPLVPSSVTLNKALIEETMYNAFDANIIKWVDYYHGEIGKPKKWPKPDPNLVKSLLYQESGLGTHGDFLLTKILPKWHPMTRFNLGQAIDSAGPQQILMIKEMDPALVKKHDLDGLMKDYYAAQARRAALVKKGASLSKPEKAELDGLDKRSKRGKRWNDYFVTDPRWTDAVEEFFTKVSPARSVDYDFWIRTAVRWFFEKRKEVSSWEAAVYAYNGDGDLAAEYKKDVIGRRDAAKAAKGDFVPKQHY